MMTVVTDFVKNNAAKIRSVDVAFLPSGVTNNVAIARAELGVNNAERAVEYAETTRQNKNNVEKKNSCVKKFKPRPRYWRESSLSTICTRMLERSSSRSITAF